MTILWNSDRTEQSLGKTSRDGHKKKTNKDSTIFNIITTKNSICFLVLLILLVQEKAITLGLVTCFGEVSGQHLHRACTPPWLSSASARSAAAVAPIDSLPPPSRTRRKGVTRKSGWSRPDHYRVPKIVQWI